jgi:hypothetical protein
MAHVMDMNRNLEFKQYSCLYRLHYFQRKNTGITTTEIFSKLKISQLSKILNIILFPLLHTPFCFSCEPKKLQTVKCLIPLALKYFLTW